MVTVVAMVTVKSNNNNLHIKVTSPVLSIREEEQLQRFTLNVGGGDYIVTYCFVLLGYQVRLCLEQIQIQTIYNYMVTNNSVYFGNQSLELLVEICNIA